ncbi:MAG: helix-turn-helix transcriptional regulator, partial [Actinobacteria bacterium]|nr:helix-turn-helix transcriptional regulator [Actinomycetota bacterium]
LIGSRWSAAHFGALLLGARRFGEVARLTGATPKVVSERLGAFVELGALRAGEDGYELTEMGEAFFVVVAPFVAWALTHRSAPDETPLSVTHTGCGEPFVPLLCCDACGGEIAVGDLLSPAGSADGRRVPR